jgi:mannose-6-phosphate isomerase
MIKAMLYKMRNQVQPYSWGDREALCELYGTENPGNEPQAELWMGGHPKAPSLLVDGASGDTVSLPKHISSDPQAALGPARNAFGDRLPFLFKVLCAAEPLSIQAHPSLSQARAGFAREEAEGPAITADNRNYRDDNHKPELICALRPFWGLRGFRTAAEIQQEFQGQEFVSSDVDLGLPETDADIRGFFHALLLLPEDERRNLVAAGLARATARWESNEGSSPPEPGNPLARYYWVERIAEVHPGDIGILSPYFLNLFSLEPGQAVYQPAGILHAYLYGVGVELMANSDNVLRGGMTVKHVDADELLEVGRFEPDAIELVEPRASDAVEVSQGQAIAFPTPFEEFELQKVTVESGTAAVKGEVPQIVFCHSGSGLIRCGNENVRLLPGESAFADAAAGSLGLEGPGEFFLARVP